ncbi:MAG: hypothetical protein COT81_01920 [Candidatus Buchananbacteria bacterium CG10_big_fil_rev_8_21_14_0_10_42_9]|uniref:DUF218 domain-containing protein n=1 Tax=Candidatus Buchananbacteria bacterium CG10_big_fil_rev_8_21_14_0_10_42_9 TaxID=1974526 RepID=A0A2H0W1T0_9BACT|nr:MAG: hypothetical protein COT81_01920 [Candidatus Buchananbacteria bacterium CG10_big_fil_rev_8_21_14_0_10_42_9]
MLGIIILGGGLIEEKDGTWRTTNFDEGDNFGVNGDRVRVVAAAYLANEYPDALLIPASGKGQYASISGAPTIASVIKQELIELGVPKDRIILEEDSKNTYQNLAGVIDIIKAKDISEIKIVSNLWHIPRVKAMIETHPKLKEFYSAIPYELVFAEDIAIENEPGSWQADIEQAYGSKAMEKRLELEDKGIEQIKNGTYQYE